MEHVSISISESLRAELEEAAREGGFPGPEALIEALVRDHRERRAELVAALIEGEESGHETRSIDEIIADGYKRAGL